MITLVRSKGKDVSVGYDQWTFEIDNNTLKMDQNVASFYKQQNKAKYKAYQEAFELSSWALQEYLFDSIVEN